jgi:hypothetical protein
MKDVSYGVDNCLRNKNNEKNDYGSVFSFYGY